MSRNIQSIEDRSMFSPSHWGLPDEAITDLAQRLYQVWKPSASVLRSWHLDERNVSCW